MNTQLNLLQPYPFEKLKALFNGVQAPNHLTPINLSIGEPRHKTPALVEKAICESLSGLSSYPPTKGSPELRQSIAQWIARRYAIEAPNPETQVLPVLGSREALFAIAQTVIKANSDAYVICPNPFYQIYEGASILAGATPYFLNSSEDKNFGYNWSDLPEDVLAKTQLLYICSPGNPAGNVLPLEEWKILFDLSDKYGFVIASDECYSEIYFDESNKPIGALQAAQQLGRHDYKNIIMFSSLSKRSNVPGMRSGFVAGDAQLIQNFLKYRTYHGSAMSPVFTAASIAAWNDEAHVIENRRLYREKFEAVYPILSEVLNLKMPDASFYFWAQTPIADDVFVQNLFAQTGVTVLPGSYLARQAHGINPGANRIRLALVADIDQCIEGVQRIASFVKNNYSSN